MIETVLLYNFEDSEKLSMLRIALMPLKLYIKQIEKKDYVQPVGFLAGIKEITPVQDAFDGDGFGQEMLIFCGLTERKLDKALQALRRRNIKISYKAILTESNKTWSGIQLYKELEEEHKRMTEND